MMYQVPEAMGGLVADVTVTVSFDEDKYGRKSHVAVVGGPLLRTYRSASLLPVMVTTRVGEPLGTLNVYWRSCP